MMSKKDELIKIKVIKKLTTKKTIWVFSGIFSNLDSIILVLSSMMANIINKRMVLKSIVKE